MVTTLVDRFLHVEVVHPRPYEAAEFLEETLGATRVERHISTYVEEILPGSECVHVSLGGVVIQLLKPTPALASWYEALEQLGPHVHNISVQAKDVNDLRDRLVSRGAIEKYSTEIQIAASEEEEPPKKAYLLDAVSASGLRFEIVPRLRK